MADASRNGRAPRSAQRFSPTFSFGAFLILLITLWVAGGASRADVPGQVVVRAFAWGVLLLAVLFGKRPSFAEARAVWIIMLSALGLVLLQLLPLPAEIWTALPGRALFLQAAAQPEPWRPWSIVPTATVNAASSLIVPLAALVLLSSMRDADRAWLPGILLATVAASAVTGLVQFSGVGFDNPLINETVGQVSGTFANRNHFALFMALGCPLALAWVFNGARRPGWRIVTGLGCILLFLLTILASGSRAGIGLGFAALLLSLLVAWRPMRQSLRRYPRWTLPALIAGFAGVIIFFTAVSIAADRAVSVDRLFSTGEAQELRSRGLPTVMEITRRYFPVGTGIGTFDPIFRIHEPLELLKPTYFNHAHNDFVEIVLESGLPGLLLLAAAVCWWIWASFIAWWREGDRHAAQPKLGSAMILLILAGSAFDYPARTPMLMTAAVIAAFWLSAARKGTTAALDGSPLPAAQQNL